MNRSLLFVSILMLMLLLGCTNESPTGVRNIEQDFPNLEQKELPPGLSAEEFEVILRSNDVIINNKLRKGTSPPSWEENYGTPMHQWDDDSRMVGLPFIFEFWGQSYNNVWVNSNGHMTFNGQNRTYWDDYPLDNIDSYYYSWRIIAPLYTDLNPSWMGEVYYSTNGAFGDRKFIATWLDVPQYAFGGSNTFQVQLFESTGQIQFGYAGLTANGWHYSRPMSVGLGAGNGNHLLYAHGSEIPALDGTNVCFTPDGNGAYFATAGPCEPPLLEVVMDILPDSDNNPINPKNKGVTPVAILSTDDYNAADIDVESLLLGNASPAHDGHYEDVDGDGDIDLLLHFRTQEMGIDSGTAELCVSGITSEGLELAGCDFVTLVGGKKK